jgi:hypothetical protein
MSVKLVPAWMGLLQCRGAGPSDTTRDRPCASFPVTIRRMPLASRTLSTPVLFTGLQTERRQVYLPARTFMTPETLASFQFHSSRAGRVRVDVKG